VDGEVEEFVGQRLSLLLSALRSTEHLNSPLLRLVFARLLYRSQMSLERGQACAYCAAIIRGNVPGSDLRPQATIETLRKSSESCMICRVLLASNIRSSQWISEELSGKYENVETLPISIKVDQVQTLHSGLMWATLTTSLNHKTSGFSYPNVFILQVCSADGTLL